MTHTHRNLGLTTMARSSEGSIWPAHFGAAAIAAYYFSASADLDAGAKEALTAQIEKMIAQMPDLFTPFEDLGPESDAETAIICALERSIHKLCDIGHNVIYAAIALRALRDTPEMARAHVTQRFVELIRKFEHIKPGMYIGGKGKRVHELRPGEDDYPIAADVTEIAETALRQLLKFEQIYENDIHKAQIGHILTHAHGLIDLLKMGYTKMVEAGLVPFRTKLKLLEAAQTFRPSNPTKWPVARRAEDSPLTGAYWARDFSRTEHQQTDWDHGHTFKYNFSFHELITCTDDAHLITACRDRFQSLI